MKKIWTLLLLFISGQSLAQPIVALGDQVAAEYYSISEKAGNNIERILKTNPAKATAAEKTITELQLAYRQYNFSYTKLAYYKYFVKKLPVALNEKFERQEENLLYYNDEIETFIAKLGKKYGKGKVGLWLRTERSKAAAELYANCIRYGKEAQQQISKLSEYQANGTLEQVAKNYLGFFTHYNLLALLTDKMDEATKQKYLSLLQDLSKIEDKIYPFEQQIWRR